MQCNGLARKMRASEEEKPAGIQTQQASLLYIISIMSLSGGEML
jgi:hypothetical protein